MTFIKKLFLWLLLFAAIYFGVTMLPNLFFGGQVKALLDETQIHYKLKSCSNGLIERRLECEVYIPSAELDQLVTKLGISKVIDVPKSKNPRSVCVAWQKEEQKEKKYIDIQSWRESKQGFIGAILFYERESGNGCLLLAIAFG